MYMYLSDTCSFRFLFDRFFVELRLLLELLFFLSLVFFFLLPLRFLFSDAFFFLRDFFLSSLLLELSSDSLSLSEALSSSEEASDSLRDDTTLGFFFFVLFLAVYRSQIYSNLASFIIIYTWKLATYTYLSLTPIPHSC